MTRLRASRFAGQARHSRNLAALKGGGSRRQGAHCARAQRWAQGRGGPGNRRYGPQGPLGGCIRGRRVQAVPVRTIARALPRQTFSGGRT